MDPDAKDLLEKHCKAQQATDREAFSYASLAAYVQQGEAAQRNIRRHEAQVDALLKIKYDQCGYPDAYQPDTEDEMSHTLINCTFNGDETIENLSKAISGSSETTETSTRTDEGEGEGKRPWWAKMLGPLAAVVLGAGITFFAASYFDNDKDISANVYDLEGLDYIPRGKAVQ